MAIRQHSLFRRFRRKKESEASQLNHSTLFIVLRQSPDWKNLTPSSFREQSRAFCKLIGRPIDQINEVVELWDSTFGISFFETRQAMKEIALGSFKSVRASRLVNLAEVRNGATQQGIYIFTDDDDWIRPNIIEAFENCGGQERAVFVWGSVAFGEESGDIIKFRELDKRCYTNNYAVDYSYFSNQPENLPQVAQHWMANITIDKQNLRLIEDYLTVTNKNPSSTLYLENTLRDNPTNDRLVETIREYNERLEHLKIPQSLTWAVPYMLQVKDFYARLLASEKP